MRLALAVQHGQERLVISILQRTEQPSPLLETRCGNKKFMKLYTKYFSVILFSALALSCAKVENEPSDPVTGQPEGELTIPESELIPGAFRAYTSGDAEGGVKDDVKAYPQWPDGNDMFVVKWKEDDKLKVFYDRTGENYGIYSLASGAGTSLGQFTLFEQNAEETGTYYAVSPAEAAKGIQSDGSLLFNKIGRAHV